MHHDSVTFKKDIVCSYWEATAFVYVILIPPNNIYIIHGDDVFIAFTASTLDFFFSYVNSAKTASTYNNHYYHQCCYWLQ